MYTVRVHLAQLGKSVQMDDITTKDHASTNEYQESASIRNNLIGIPITKFNNFGRRKIKCYEWEPPKLAITHTKSVTCQTFRGCLLVKEIEIRVLL